MTTRARCEPFCVLCRMAAETRAAEVTTPARRPAYRVTPAGWWVLALLVSCGFWALLVGAYLVGAR